MSTTRKRSRRAPDYPDLGNPQLAELEARYHEVDCRVRPDNPRDVVLMKVQRDRWLRNLQQTRGKVAAEHYPAVRQFDQLISAWYKAPTRDDRITSV